MTAVHTAIPPCVVSFVCVCVCAFATGLPAAAGTRYPCGWHCCDMARTQQLRLGTRACIGRTRTGAAVSARLDRVWCGRVDRSTGSPCREGLRARDILRLFPTRRWTDWSLMWSVIRGGKMLFFFVVQVASTRLLCCVGRF